MRKDTALLVTDLVDSVGLAARLGDDAAASLFARHDRIARDLLGALRGQEIDKTDGFLLLFDSVDDAVAYANAYHAALNKLDATLQARAGIHFGSVVVRENAAADVARGAKPVEIEGIAKAVAARVMALAGGGQTLLTGSARDRFVERKPVLVPLGHWRLKGVAEPVALLAPSDGDTTPPPDSAKAYRVTQSPEGWVTAGPMPGNLPAERDLFVGRQATAAEIVDAFERGARLVTLTGIGGIGKTRLALNYARARAGEYPGGIWVCDLSQATSVDGIAHATAHALDTRLGKQDPVAQLGASIAARGVCLVVLDNFEQIVAHAEKTVGIWLAQAGAARFLVTSRESLGIAGEHVVALPSLTEAEGLDLFHRRAQAAGARYDEGAGGAAFVGQLVSMLDGLPLAIELAAGRAALLSPEMMLRRMSERFKLLSTGSSAKDGRRTLRATLDWSWDLLTPPERTALAQLSVFEGGFSLDAVEAVLDPASMPAGQWTADLVQSLLNKSLIRQRPPGRFDLLGAVRDYARERLTEAAPGGVAARNRHPSYRRHWTYYAGLTEAAATANRCAELDNLVAACRRAAAAGDVDRAVTALALCWSALRLTGPFRAAIDLATNVEASGALSSSQQATIDRVVGGALSVSGDWEGAGRRLQASLEHVKALGDDNAQAQVLCLLAELALARGAEPEAQERLEQALQLANGGNDAPTSFRVFNSLGALHLRQMKLDDARHDYTAALEHAQHADDRRWIGGLHGNLGTIAQMQGQLDLARSHYAQGLELVSAVGDRQWEGNIRCNFGFLLHQLGQHEAAIAEQEATLKIAKAIGHVRLEATATCNLAIAQQSMGKLDAALASYDKAVAAAERLDDPTLEASFRGYLGLALALSGRREASLACFDRALARLVDVRDASTLGMVYCKQAIAAAHLGDRSLHATSLAHAEAVLAPLDLGKESELAQELDRARSAAR